MTEENVGYPTHLKGEIQMKRKIIAILCAAVMVVAMCIPAFAAETPSKADGRTNLAAGLTAVLVKGDGTETSLGNGARLTDGNLADNKANHCDGKWDSKGEKDARNGNAPANYSDAPALAMTVDGAAKNYFYAVRLDLPAASDVDGFTLYLQAYKRIIMDRGFDILVSADGTNWTKVYSAKVADTLTHEDYNAVYAGIADRDSGDPTDEPAMAITASFDKLTGINHVAYACTMYREMNGYYTARFTEFEVYGTAGTPAATSEEATTTEAPAATSETPAASSDAPAESSVPAADESSVAPVESGTPADSSEEAEVSDVPGSAEADSDDTTAVPADDTTATAADDTTAAGTAETTDAAKDKGCGSVTVCAAVVAAVAATAFVYGKKED